VKGGRDMSAKTQLVNILDFIGEKEANQLLQYVKDSFLLKPRTWDDIEEDDPTPDEMAIIAEYRKNKESY